jgi:hypothetical protein
MNYVYKTKSTLKAGTIAANKIENHPLFLTKNYWQIVKKNIRCKITNKYFGIRMARQRTELQILKIL